MYIKRFSGEKKGSQNNKSIKNPEKRLFQLSTYPKVNIRWVCRSR